MHRESPFVLTCLPIFCSACKRKILICSKKEQDANELTQKRHFRALNVTKMRSDGRLILPDSARIIDRLAGTPIKRNGLERIMIDQQDQNITLVERIVEREE